MPDLLSLTFEVQVALIAGYLGHVNTTSGFRKDLATEDRILQILVFGLPAVLTMRLLVPLAQSTTDGYWSTILHSVIALLAVGISIAIAIGWRVVLQDMWYAFLSKRKLSLETGKPTTWDSIIQDRKLNWTQISVTTEDGNTYICTDASSFNNAAMKLPDVDREGNIAIYADQVRLPDGSIKEQKGVCDPAYGDRLTYIPAERIANVQIRLRS